MEQLLSIQAIPIEFTFKISTAKLEMSTEQPQGLISRRAGKLSISHVPAELRLDTYESRSSMGLKSVMRVSKEAAIAGKMELLEKIGKMAQKGDMLMDTYKNISIADITKIQSAKPTSVVELAFIPSVSANINYEPEHISMQYDAERLIFDWQVQSSPSMRFVPAKIEFDISQYPDLRVEYIGDPIYVPPSANPEYEPGFDIFA